MVEGQLRRRGIRDSRVLTAMLEIPRQLFVPPESRVSCYGDFALPIGYGQTISQPYMTALMAEALELRGAETVLEIGAGSGYAAAVLGALAARVVSLEIVPALAERAKASLRAAGCGGNAEVIAADGAAGYAPLAPYDAISVAACAPEIPVALLEQLADSGRMAIPVGGPTQQNLVVVSKRGGRIFSRISVGCLFVPLRGGVK